MSAIEHNHRKDRRPSTPMYCAAAFAALCLAAFGHVVAVELGHHAISAGAASVEGAHVQPMNVGEVVIGFAQTPGDPPGHPTMHAGIVACLVRTGSVGRCVRDPAWLCDGDVDGSGTVNPVDLGLVHSAFGSTAQQDLCNYDLDCDGKINPVDLSIVQSLFGTCDLPRAVCP